MAILQDIHTILLRESYPATRDELIDALRREGKPEEMVARLQRIPEMIYGSVDSVMDAIRAEEEIGS